MGLGPGGGPLGAAPQLAPGAWPGTGHAAAFGPGGGPDSAAPKVTVVLGWLDVDLGPGGGPLGAAPQLAPGVWPGTGHAAAFGPGGGPDSAAPKVTVVPGWLDADLGPGGGPLGAAPQLAPGVWPGTGHAAAFGPGGGPDNAAPKVTVVLGWLDADLGPGGAPLGAAPQLAPGVWPGTGHAAAFGPGGGPDSAAPQVTVVPGWLDVDLGPGGGPLGAAPQLAPGVWPGTGHAAAFGPGGGPDSAAPKVTVVLGWLDVDLGPGGGPLGAAPQLAPGVWPGAAAVELGLGLATGTALGGGGGGCVIPSGTGNEPESHWATSLPSSSLSCNALSGMFPSCALSL